MTEHKWILFDDGSGAFCRVPHCGVLMSRHEVEAHLDTVEQLVKAAKWVLHVAHDIGKSGGIPSDEEKLACMNDLKDAYEASCRRRND